MLAARTMGHYNMKIEVSTFLSTLTKFSIIQYSSVRTKNLRAIWWLLGLAMDYGDILGESWEDI